MLRPGYECTEPDGILQAVLPAVVAGVSFPGGTEYTLGYLSPFTIDMTLLVTN
jgi:hypothetical protein